MEMVENSQNVTSFIQNELVRDTLLALENDILKGNGTTPTMKGLQHSDHYTAAAIPSDYTLASGITPTEMDVLRAIITQMQNAYFSPGVILMHPTDVTALKLEKLSGTDKRYVERLMQVGSTLTLDGMPIIETTAITAGDYLIGDMSKALIAEKGSIMVEVGLDGNDFTNNMRTIIGEWRGEVIIQNNDLTAFVSGDFTTDKAALETA